MQVQSKEQFINLLLVAMATSGTMIDSFDFKEDIFELMQDTRFNSIFAFFKSLEDLDFESILKKYMNEDFIFYYNQEDGKLTIGLKYKMFESEAAKIYKGFNKEITDLMILFLRENSLNQSLETQYLGKKIKGRYNLVNPNGIYTVNRNMRLISNGDIKILKGYSVLVEKAYFTVIEKLKKGEVISFKLLCAFEDLRYVSNVMRNIINIDTPIGFYEETYRPDIVAERKKIEELKRARIYRYNIL